MVAVERVGFECFRGQFSKVPLCVLGLEGRGQHRDRFFLQEGGVGVEASDLTRYSNTP